MAALGSRRLTWWPVSSHRTSCKFYGTFKMCPLTLHDCQLLNKGTLKKKNMALEMSEMQQPQEEAARQAGSAMMRKAAAAHITHISH